jgi:hypothetical protein
LPNKVEEFDELTIVLSTFVLLFDFEPTPKHHSWLYPIDEKEKPSVPIILLLLLLSLRKD